MRDSYERLEDWYDREMAELERLLDEDQIGYDDYVKYQKEILETYKYDLNMLSREDNY